ncbi:hypothetical protein Amsp01_070670 [Amycolatopsis sp. NBRC 101858]|uniref:hypothetical protein n=1 Tax=Amycolatopsis sp. NBRC 101858 TaxID=3032200 RepID=UPI0024A20B17|nr:hypothetical protein [Amycolatopsis sp. NBRC 101858]GLY41044.1 hypothetical protein Amsp01_070670 [Amycolatopsis sp. NBRC 101858]
MKRALPALVLVLATSACTSAVSGTAKPLDGNLAVVNGPGTATALDAVKTAAEAVFSYDSTNPAAWEKAAGDNVTGDAKTQLTTLFEDVRKNPRPVRLTTRVLRSAALELAGDRVQALAALQQVNGATKALATVAFTAVRGDGHWRISDIKVNPALPPLTTRPDDGGPVGLRDSALAGARADATALFTVDRADPEGSYARAEAVIAEPLLSDYRAKKAAFLQGVHDNGTGVAVPALVAGLTTVTAEKASALLFTTLKVTNATGTTDKPLTVTLDLVREGGVWKATRIEAVTAS